MPVAREYLRSLALAVFEANPETFSGRYDRSKFCFNVEPSADINGSASVATGALTLTSGAVLQAGNDADLVSLLCHELAHVTMQTPFTRHEKVEAGATAEEKSRLQELDATQEALASEANAASDEFDKIFELIELRDSNVIDDLVSTMKAEIGGQRTDLATRQGLYAKFVTGLVAKLTELGRRAWRRETAARSTFAPSSPG